MFTHDPRGAEDLVGGWYACRQQPQQRADLAVVSLAGHDRLERGRGLLGGERATRQQHGKRGRQVARRVRRLELGGDGAISSHIGYSLRPTDGVTR